ncbi:MAG TPA: hypothetical protein VKZ53_30855, partial [Candidatus Angelobacter sp.]|nr:hypothetical protein [Candidatus Angelobacter sp.]
MSIQPTSISSTPNGSLSPAVVRHDIRNVLNHIIGYGEMCTQTAEDYGASVLVHALNEISAIAKSILPILGKWNGPMASEDQSEEISSQIVTQSQRLNEIEMGLAKHADSIEDPSFSDDLKRLKLAAQNLVSLSRQLKSSPEPESSATLVFVSQKQQKVRATLSLSTPASESSKGLILVADDQE